MNLSRMQNYSRMDDVQSPVIPIIADMIASHPGTISLGQGVVYYGPPAKAYTALATIQEDDSLHIYGHTAGLKSLRQQIAEKLRLDNQIDTQQGYDVIVTAGSNMGFLNAILATTRPGDEVILSVPYYFNHEMAIRMIGCEPVLVNTNEDYQLCIDAIEKAITHKTRAIVTISPNNPTGVVYNRTVLEQINSLCDERGVYHISDEAYEYFTYGQAQHFSPGSLDNAAEHTISLFSLSKAYGLANWRIGYMVIPKHLQTAVYKIQDTNVICPSIPSQLAASGALAAGRDYCDKKRAVISENRNIMLPELEKIGDICTVSDNQGAFYLLLKVHTELDDMSVIKHLVKDYRVAALPGSTFGMPPSCYLRVAYGALNRENATEGIQRLKQGLSEIVRH
jgi:aspartate/methionine/tyrosine aminotransferase